MWGKTQGRKVIPVHSSPMNGGAEGCVGRAGGIERGNEALHFSVNQTSRHYPSGLHDGGAVRESLFRLAAAASYIAFLRLIASNTSLP